MLGFEVYRVLGVGGLIASGCFFEHVWGFQPSVFRLLQVGWYLWLING